MDEVQKFTSIDANTPSSETYRSDLGVDGRIILKYM
jgi:hypothetical protein